MDADGFALKNLDHLFSIDFGHDHSGNPIQIAAPQGCGNFGNFLLVVTIVVLFEKDSISGFLLYRFRLRVIAQSALQTPLR